jgi:acyl-coenzyme A synthetase/AMP-(fatty) acid ligase
MIDFFLNQFEENKHKTAIIWNETVLSYADLLLKIKEAREFIKLNKIHTGKVISLTGDFTPNAIAILLALIENNNIIAPFNYPLKDSEYVKFKIAEVEGDIIVDVNTDEYTYSTRNVTNSHELIKALKNISQPGLILFTSGTSGFPKAAVHNFNNLLTKFKLTRKSFRTINFLLFDHWGGLNTLFHTLSNAGVVLALKNRKPEAVCKFIEDYKIELLPVSPSFLNLLILSEVFKSYNLSSLQIITYGTEPMPMNTLKKAKEIFQNVKFQQTYGLIELGVLRSQSKSDNSLWVKLGGEGYDLRVVDNILQIKADSAMLGYLNAPSPFTDDGYFITGDQVEYDGVYYKILGRKSEIINVGGDKVYPQEVENVLLSMDNIIEATVYPEKHPLLGNIVCAKILVKEGLEHKDFTREVKRFCKSKLQSFKVPVKISIVDSPLYNDRFKKKRNLN